MKKADALRVLPFGTVCKRIVDLDGNGIYKVITEDGNILAEHIHSNEIWGIAADNYIKNYSKEGASFTVLADESCGLLLGCGEFELSTSTEPPKIRHWRDMPVLGCNYYVKPRYVINFSNREYFKHFPSNSVFIAHKIVNDEIYTYTNGFTEGTPICHLDDFHMLDVSL